jgi:ATP-binding cassette subfamily B protein
MSAANAPRNTQKRAPTEKAASRIAESTEHEIEATRDLDWGQLRRLLAYLKPYRLKVSVTAVLIVLVSGLSIVGPYLVKVAIDRSLQGEGPAPERLRILGIVGALYLGVLLVTGLLSFFQSLLLQEVGQKVMNDLRRQLFRHVMRQDMSLFDREPVGRLMTRLTSDVEALNELFTSGVVTIAMDALTLIAIMTIMLVMDVKLALISFAIIPALFALSMIFRTRVRRAFRRIRVRVARINGFLQEHLSGLSIVQAFGQESRRLDRFDSLNEDHTAAHLETVAAFAVFFPAVEVFSTAAVVLLLWTGSAMVAATTVTLGTLVAFVQYAQRFYRPISDLSEKFNIMQGAMAAGERVFVLLDTHPSILTPKAPRGVERVKGEVSFEKVCFSYEEQERVLNELSFHVRPGERVALVGATGAGKTTIISLLTRFYEVDEGCISIDGIDVRDWDPRELRRQVGVVLQDPRLFSGSLDSNLKLWREDFDQKSLDEAIQRIGLERVIRKLPDGLAHELGEGGGRLSTGERQLVSFARALAHDPPILVLDEATASVDAATEARIQTAIEVLMEGRTSLVIAHRLSTVRSVDRILVLHHGRLVEEGSHEELLARPGGIYRKLVEIQLQRTRHG